MLEEVRELKDRVGWRTGLAAASDPAMLETLALLEREVQRRLAFEEALLAYLERCGTNPASAAADFRAFLLADLDQERRAVPC